MTMAEIEDGQGSAFDAIEFALSLDDAFETQAFLRDWRDRSIDREEWADYFEWLSALEDTARKDGKLVKNEPRSVSDKIRQRKSKKVRVKRGTP